MEALAIAKADFQHLEEQGLPFQKKTHVATVLSYYEWEKNEKDGDMPIVECYWTGMFGTNIENKCRSY